MGKLVPTELALKSKSERGYDLIDGKPTQAVRAEEIKLQRGMRTADAFRVIGRSILRQIASNEAPVRKSDPEDVHQMRIGLRRLVRPYRCSRNYLATRIQSEQSRLKWLTEELAPARDLDVYERSTIEPLRHAQAAKRGMKELASALASRRAAAFDKAKAAVNSLR